MKYNLLVIYLLTLIVFLALDSIWLGKVSPKLYKHYLKEVLATKPNLVAGGVFYLLFIVGLLFFVIYPNQHQSWHHYLLFSAMYGLMTYATFDLTSQAILKKWSSVITVIDMTWGVIITSLTTLVVMGLLR